MMANSGSRRDTGRARLLERKQHYSWTVGVIHPEVFEGAVRGVASWHVVMFAGSAHGIQAPQIFWWQLPGAW
jgi:hypothetical protein